jgi:hypothetical protein
MGATGVILSLPVAAIVQAVISTTIGRHQVIDEAEFPDRRDEGGSGPSDMVPEGPA